MNLRSVLQIMTFLSKGVCVPDDHVISGIAPITPDGAGQPFDWTQVTAGNFTFTRRNIVPRPRRSRYRTAATGFISRRTTSSRGPSWRFSRSPVRPSGIG